MFNRGTGCVLAAAGCVVIAIAQANAQGITQPKQGKGRQRPSKVRPARKEVGGGYGKPMKAR
jgi:hypothetical protein